MIRYPRAVSATQPRMVSYAQNGEDVMIDRIFRKSSGFFIDVGAFHPVVDSVTRHFSLLGWTGINIEADPDLCAEIARDRPNDITLHCAAGRKTGETILHRIGSRQCSTTSPEQFARFDPSVREASRTFTVPVRTLADICGEYVRSDIDFLKIDVEGSERDVILGADWTRFRPRLLVIEATRTGTSEPEHDAWEPVLLENGYHFQYFDGINRYYLRTEDLSLADQMAAPVNYLDWYFSFRDMVLMGQLTGAGQAAADLYETTPG
ncbi:MAG: FkbM family methyltransferase [Telmatospirillum sp.]|nr:FkbM family methyltransferase [Telmatospirillum sp.]